MNRYCHICKHKWTDSVSPEDEKKNREYISNFKLGWEDQKKKGMSDIVTARTMGNIYFDRYLKLSLLYDCPTCGGKEVAYVDCAEAVVNVDLVYEVKSVKSELSPIAKLIMGIVVVVLWIVWRN